MNDDTRLPRSTRLPIRSRGGRTTSEATPRFAKDPGKPDPSATMPREKKKAKLEHSKTQTDEQLQSTNESMADRRQQAVASSSRNNTGVRRNLFHQHLSRRPTTSSSNGTSADTLRLDMEAEEETSDIVARDRNGDYQIGDPPIPPLDEQEDQANEMMEDEKEKQRLADAVKHHQRDRNRAPSEPVELLEAVKTSLRAKTAALSDDNWMYEAEEDTGLR